MAEEPYNGLSRDALVDLLATSPFIGSAWKRDEGVEISIVPSGGRRVGTVELPPAAIIDGLLSGDLSRHHRLVAVFQINAIPSGASGKELVTAQIPNTAMFPRWEEIPLRDFLTEATVDSKPMGMTVDGVWETITDWADLLWPQGNEEKAGKYTSFAATGASTQALARGDNILNGGRLGNPWHGSDFVELTKIVVNEDAMYHEIYKGGKLWWRNGEIVDTAVAAEEASSKKDKAEVAKALIDQIAAE